MLDNFKRFGIAATDVFVVDNKEARIVADGDTGLPIFICRAFKHSIPSDKGAPYIITDSIEGDYECNLHGVDKRPHYVGIPVAVQAMRGDAYYEEARANRFELFEFNGEIRPIRLRRETHAERMDMERQRAVRSRLRSEESDRITTEMVTAAGRWLVQQWDPRALYGNDIDERKEKQRKEAEARAQKSLRELVGEKEYIRYLANDAVSVFGESGRLYKVYKGDQMTKVYDKSGYLGQICVVTPDKDIPPTDSIISRIVMIQTDEGGFYDKGNLMGNIKKPNGK